MYVCKNTKLIKIFHCESGEEQKNNMKMKKLCVKYLIHKHVGSHENCVRFYDGLALLLGSFGKEEQSSMKHTKAIKMPHIARSSFIQRTDGLEKCLSLAIQSLSISVVCGMLTMSDFCG